MPRRTQVPRKPEVRAPNEPISYSADNRLLESSVYVKVKDFIDGHGSLHYPRAFAALTKTFGIPLKRKGRRKAKRKAK